MKKSNIILAVLITFSSAVFAQKTFTLSSSDLGGEATINEEFNGFGCTGENQSPQLSWKNAPEGTKSFAVTMYDPDAPTGSGWWHWVVFDIPENTNELVSGAGNTMTATFWEYDCRLGRRWNVDPVVKQFVTQVVGQYDPTFMIKFLLIFFRT